MTDTWHSKRHGMIAIGIDVGGTQTRAAAVDRSGRVLARRSCATDGLADGGALIAWLAEQVTALREGKHTGGARVKALGLALPGLIDRERGVLTRSINLPWLEGRAVADELSRETGVDVTLTTDAAAAVWGEYTARPARAERFVHLRLGTGVACGVVIGGVLQDLTAGRTAHLDALVVNDQPDAPMCRCGRRGCLELFASGAALIAQGQKAGHANGLTGLQRAWQRGEGRATELVERTAVAVAKAVANLARRFDADIVNLGGGVLSLLPAVMEATQRLASEAVSMEGRSARVVLERCRLGDDAGVIGAALLDVTDT